MHDYSGMNTPSVWRSARSQAAAKVDALASNGILAPAAGRPHATAELCISDLQEPEARPRQERLELPIKADQVFGMLVHRRCQPAIWQMVARPLPFQAELPKLWPLGAQGRQLHAGHDQRRIDEGHGLGDGGRLHENL